MSLAFGHRLNIRKRGEYVIHVLKITGQRDDRARRRSLEQATVVGARGVDQGQLVGGFGLVDRLDLVRGWRRGPRSLAVRPLKRDEEF